MVYDCYPMITFDYLIIQLIHMFGRIGTTLTKDC